MPTRPDQAEQSTAGEKLTVCLAAFGCSCVAFLLAATVMLPALGFLSDAVHLPKSATVAMTLLTLFGSPIVAAIYGIHISSPGATTQR